MERETTHKTFKAIECLKLKMEKLKYFNLKCFHSRWCLGGVILTPFPLLTMELKLPKQ